MAHARDRRWTREELILGFNLYCKIPFGSIHTRNPKLQELARLLGRSVNAVALKLSNFARLDPALQARGIRGMAHGSKADAEIWDEFYADGESLAFESERLLAEYTGRSVEALADIEEIELPREGKERERIVRVRVNQYYFREMILARYETTCCITGLKVRSLLVAGHIIPWSVEPKLRMNPQNGLCLNALHDRAFDYGLLTITANQKVAVSRTISKSSAEPAVKRFLMDFDGAPLILPKRFRPDFSFFEFRTHIFRNQEANECR